MAEDFYALKGGKDEDDGEWYWGRARLFIINKYPNLKRKDFNYDFNIDVNAIRTSLSPLKIKLDKPIIDPTAEKMKACLKEKINYFGCVIIFVFSHGEKDHIWCSDYDEKTKEGKINVWNDYYHYFSGHINPELQKCPKVFFNEWCQNVSENFKEDMVNRISDSYHNAAHWLIYNAAQPGYLNHVHEEEGSLSTKFFCELLTEYGRSKDLQHILTLVKEKVCSFNFGGDNYLQPMTYSSLVKKLYLLPEEKVLDLNSNYRKEFEHLEVLGCGAFGVVFRARNFEDKTEYAVKRIQLKNNTESELRKVKHEFESLAQLEKCAQIVGYNRVWYEFVKFDQQSQQDAKLNITGLTRTGSDIRLCFIQMELCGKSLETYLQNKDQRDTVESLHIFNQIIQGLAFIHNKNLVHRDIKPSNILFAITENESDLSIRIADFGLARNVDNFNTTGIIGTPLYMAPEMATGDFFITSDLYSAGLILIELLSNCSENHEKILSDAKKNFFPEPLEKELKFALPTVKNLLSKQPNDRPSSYDLLTIVSNWNKNLKSLTLSTQQLKGSTASSTEEVQFESNCTLEEHEVSQLTRKSTVGSLQWNGKEGDSEILPLPAAAASNTRWEVLFRRCPDSDFMVFLRCKSLDAQFRAASVRLLALVEDHPQVWTEAADVLKCGEDWSCCGWFSKKMSKEREVKPLKVRVLVQWTELNQLPKLDFWNDSSAHIRCRWKLDNWNIVTPNSEEWWLFSEHFELRGIVWRIAVLNLNSDSGRQLVVRVWLQHLPESDNRSRLTWKCSLCVSAKPFPELKKNVEQSSYCEWTVVNDVNSKPLSLLDLNVMIYVSRKN